MAVSSSPSSSAADASLATVSAAESALPHRVRRLSIHKDRVLPMCSFSTRSRFQLLAVTIIALGSISILLEGLTICHRAFGESNMMRRGVNFVHLALGEQTGSEETAVALTASAPGPTPPPFFSSATEQQCFYTRDVGLISEIQENTKVFCATQQHQNDPTTRTKVSYLDLADRGIEMRAMVFDRDLQLDFSEAVINHPIKSLADDGGNHDPRFNWNPSMVSCGCSEFQQYAHDFLSSKQRTLRPWDPVLAQTAADADEFSTVCGTPPLDTTSATSPTTPMTTTAAAQAPLVTINEKVVLIARRDDHNPFFQISSAVSAWLFMRTLGWNRNDVRVIHMDGGYPSPIDTLHHRLLSSPLKYELLNGQDHLLGKKYQFTNEVLVVPYENTGPMMQHLNDKEPCEQSQLFKEFRSAALETMGVVPDNYDTTQQITVTIITRRNYGGRTVQRRWLNENEILASMRETYRDFNGVPIVFQSVDYVGLSLHQQMEITLKSDVVIGMHGAGMVNVLWTKPETLVVEIFPRQRKRWGYRNLCRYIGCDWHQFRGGKDTGKGDNSSDKRIPVETWTKFFDPLFRGFLDKVVTSKLPQTAESSSMKVEQRLRQ